MPKMAPEQYTAKQQQINNNNNKKNQNDQYIQSNCTVVASGSAFQNQEIVYINTKENQVPAQSMGKISHH